MTSVAPILTRAEPFACHKQLVYQPNRLELFKKKIFNGLPAKFQLIKVLPGESLQFQPRLVDMSISFYHHIEDHEQCHLV